MVLLMSANWFSLSVLGQLAALPKLYSCVKQLTPQLQPVEQLGAAALRPLFTTSSELYDCGHKLIGSSVVPTTKGPVTSGTHTAMVVQSGSSQSTWPSQSSS